MTENIAPIDMPRPSSQTPILVEESSIGLGKINDNGYLPIVDSMVEVILMKSGKRSLFNPLPDDKF